MFCGYHFNEVDGTNVLDVSTNSQTGTFGFGTGQAFVTGLWGTALSLNGNGGVGLPALTFDVVSDLTVFCWINWNGGSAGRQTVFGRATIAVSNWVFSVFNYKMEINSSYDLDVVNGVDVSTGVWTPVAWVRRNGLVNELYQNGVLVATGRANNATLSDIVTPCIGGGQQCTSNFFNGKIEDLVVYERALSYGEVISLSKGRNKNADYNDSNSY